MNDLVNRLSSGEHPVEISLRPERSVAAFRACLERGYVLVKFTDTRGGTELGVRLDPELTELSTASFSMGQRTRRVVGVLTLDYVPVRCVAEINVEALAGTGHLESIQDN